MILLSNRRPNEVRDQQKRRPSAIFLFFLQTIFFLTFGLGASANRETSAYSRVGADIRVDIL